MGDSLQIEFEFEQKNQQTDLTESELTEVVREAFLHAGVDHNTINNEINEVHVKKETPLAIDPGTTAVIVATIGLGMELIKLGVDWFKYKKELSLKQEELDIKKREFEASHIGETAQIDEQHQLITEFVTSVLLEQLLEIYGLKPKKVALQLIETSDE